VSSENAILYGVFEDCTWIRCVGKGSFMTSPLLKDCAEQRLAQGEKYLVVDLEACTGMDSTFMGLLAGLSARIMKNAGAVQVTAANERNQRSLEDLGLDCLLDINPESAPWKGKEQEIRSKLSPVIADSPLDSRERAKQVLDAHKTLASTSEENAKRFSSVVTLLENEVAGQDKGE
jgi:anti-sigma B factor antagonist